MFCNAFIIIYSFVIEQNKNNAYYNFTNYLNFPKCIKHCQMIIKSLLPLLLLFINDDTKDCLVYPVSTVQQLLVYRNFRHRCIHFSYKGFRTFLMQKVAYNYYMYYMHPVY